MQYAMDCQEQAAEELRGVDPATGKAQRLPYGELQERFTMWTDAVPDRELADDRPSFRWLSDPALPEAVLEITTPTPVGDLRWRFGGDTAELTDLLRRLGLIDKREEVPP